MKLAGPEMPPCEKLTCREFTQIAYLTKAIYHPYEIANDQENDPTPTIIVSGGSRNFGGRERSSVAELDCHIGFRPKTNKV